MAEAEQAVSQRLKPYFSALSLSSLYLGIDDWHGFLRAGCKLWAGIGKAWAESRTRRGPTAGRRVSKASGRAKIREGERHLSRG